MKSVNASALVLVAAGAILWFWIAQDSAMRTVRLDDAPIDAKWPDMRVNVNTAPAEELSLLPGFGPGIARRVIDDRERNGRFASIEELDRVPGIGMTLVDRIREYAIAE